MAGERTDVGGCARHEERLAALLDGELPATETAVLRRHLAECDACTCELERQRLARAVLRASGEGLSATEALRARVLLSLQAAAEPRSQRPRRTLLYGGLAAAMLLVATLAVWRFAIYSPSTPLLARAVALYRQETLAGAPVAFASADPDAVAAWASARGERLDVPRLDGYGYLLLGARPEPALGADAVTLVYEGSGGRVSCVVLSGRRAFARTGTTPTGAPTFHVWRSGDAAVVGWSDEDATYLLAAGLDQPRLLTLALAAAASH
jgi:anti-sigma factor RsiW